MDMLYAMEFGPETWKLNSYDQKEGFYTFAMNSDGFLVFGTHCKYQSSPQVRSESQYVTHCAQTKSDFIVVSTGDSPSIPSVYI